MKFSCNFMLALCVATAQGALSDTPDNTTSSPTSSSTGSVDAPVCGAGFTYCGYILRDHKNFPEQDIIQAYCAAHKDNCINGTTKTDPIEGLYLCVPPDTTPIEVWAGSPHHHDGLSHNAKLLSPRNHRQSHRQFHHHRNLQQQNPTLNKRMHHYHHHNHNQKKPSLPAHLEAAGQQQQQQQQQQQHSPAATPALPAAQTATTNPPSSSSSSSNSPDGSSPSNGGGSNSGSGSGSGGCPSSPANTPGNNNKIELLCACGRQCLNPRGDHIGRCDVPCSS
ncbi:hypothetical protein C8A00DRAFT_29910 [Chaetomidium leptoderma]|uniref:Uncharacterized protein n=1 Tax=Chaetomidium leptoderma TaxID=669021 RepID=A0AAN6VT74_9PEZI|nr:hypothetical protein C8A00DRAFT_29910 [Chaetomidium leptoderma]